MAPFWRCGSEPEQAQEERDLVHAPLVRTPPAASPDVPQGGSAGQDRRARAGVILSPPREGGLSVEVAAPAPV